MKGKSRIILLCAALFALTVIAGLLHTSPALAWDTWPAATTSDQNHTWTVVFEQAMDTATINSQNIYVSTDINGSSRIAGINAGASDGTHALVSPPAGGWSAGVNYYLIITQNVLTSEGAPLKDTIRMPFSYAKETVAKTIDVINDGSQIIVLVNGSKLNFDQPPYISNGRTMVPFRIIAEALGANVEWDSVNNKISVIGNNVVELVINSSMAKINGSSITLDAPAVVAGGRTMVPLRFVGEALGAKVNYMSNSTSINSNNEGKNNEGNTPGNINNLGLVCQNGNWIYFSNVNDGYKLYRMRLDGSGRQKLNDNKSYYINVVGDWIYYKMEDGTVPSYIYRIHFDGTGEERLYKGYDIRNVYVVNNTIYFSEPIDGIQKMSLDGTNRRQINGNYVDSMIVQDDSIYFNQSLWGRILKVRTDGSGLEMLRDNPTTYVVPDCYYLRVVNNWIYYRCGYDDRKIYRMRTDGSQEVKISDSRPDAMNISGDWLYFSNRDDGDRIYRMHKDGGGEEKLCEYSTNWIIILGDWLYFGNDKMYRMHLDGSMLMEVL